MTDSDRHVDRWVTVSQAALTAGVSERRIRRWMAAGRLPSREGEGARLVPVEAVRRMTVTDRQAPDTMTDDTAVSDRHPSELAQALAMVDRVTRENVELAGRVGFLQAEVLQLRGQVKLLAAPAPEPVNEPAPAQQVDEPMTVDTTPPVLSPVRGTETAPTRPWWRFWGTWAGEPA